METTIWILKGFIALLFTFTGLSKIVLPKTKQLDKGMIGLIGLSEKQIKLTGFLEILGASGMILPSLLNIYPDLSAIASLCLGVTMIVKGWIHVKTQTFNCSQHCRFCVLYSDCILGIILRDMLNETYLPEPITPVNNIEM